MVVKGVIDIVMKWLGNELLNGWGRNGVFAGKFGKSCGLL